MAIAIKSLHAYGPGLTPAFVTFNGCRSLIRGPSETGKSHIWDCIWFLLGGTGVPEQFPESEGYDSLVLSFIHDQHEYVVRKGMAGGPTRVLVRRSSSSSVEGQSNPFLDVDEDLGELLVRLSGAEGKVILRSRSDKGPVTGDDLRHWALLSQTEMISKVATKGNGHGSDKRVSSYSLILSGLDDSAVELYKSSSFKEQTKGKLAAAELQLARVQSLIPSDADRTAAVTTLQDVDRRIDLFSTQLQARSTVLKDLRQRISLEGDELAAASRQLASSMSVQERFTLLDLKYSSDLERLGATDESISFFQTMEETPCPLCNRATEANIGLGGVSVKEPGKYRVAIAAEAEKIRALRRGLQHSLAHESARIATASADVSRLTSSLRSLEEQEISALQGAREEFDVDPRTLADSHTRLSFLVDAFDEADRLAIEVSRLKQEAKQKRSTLVRNVGSHGDRVGEIALQMINAWGFKSVRSVHVDARACDLLIDGRRRLSFGAGKRGLFRTAMTVALMQHALQQGNPHLGVVILDSPLKAYAQKELADNADRDVPLATVKASFYRWLSEFQGPGQVIVLENEAVDADTARALDAIEFSDDYTRGRQGFYPPKTGVTE
ncbi:hypothetical protein [Stenotrophomonas cyclobalanopsidis]|uniref:hypothetical protein n=1 Tax=Stenotrophomonas cyclobalanopsidis TaxID=2771362 RepID=UPI00345FD1D5